MIAIRQFFAVAILAFAATGTAHAAKLETFLADMAPAYEKVRNAMFYLQRGAAAPAAAEINAARDLWRRQVLPYADTPPGAFADDPDFASTLEKIGADFRAAVEAGTLDATMAALEDIPAKWAELRARNHVIVFADHVGEANRAMDRLWVYRHREIDFSDQTIVDDLRARLAVTAYAYERCLNAAPDEIAEDPAFQRMVSGTLASLQKMWPAIASGERETIVSILREVRSFDKLLWLHYG